MSNFDLTDTGSLGAGAALGTSALMDYRNPLRVTLTYGSGAGFGAGHKEPGLELDRIIKKIQADKSTHPFQYGTAILADKKNGKGIEFLGDHVKGKHDLLISAGHGIDEHRLPSVKGQLRSQFGPRVAYGGRAMLQNDIGGPGYGFDSYHHQTRLNPMRKLMGRLGLRDSLLSWGPDWHKSMGDPYGWDWSRKKRGLGKHVEDVYLGYGHPTVGPSTLDNIDSARNKGWSGAVDDVLKAEDVPQDIKDKLLKLRDKKVMAVTGGGQGRLVATKIRELEALARKQGIDPKDLHFLGMQGTAKQFSPAAHLTPDSEFKTLLDRLDRKHFAALSGAADTHWSIPGASQAAESMAAGNKTLYDSSAKNLAKSEVDFINSHGDDVFKNTKTSKGWLKTILGMRDPNSLTRIEASSHPGISSVSSTEEALKKFISGGGEDINKLRGESVSKLHREAAGNLENSIRRLINRQSSWKNLRTGAKGVGALGLLAYPFMASGNNDKRVMFGDD